MRDHNDFLASQQARAAVRHKLFEPVCLRSKSGPVRAHILDLSISGALVHADRPPTVGAQVTVECDTFVALARVMWVRAKRFGIQFDTALSGALIDRALKVGALLT